jgi:hypothetical protein
MSGKPSQDISPIADALDTNKSQQNAGAPVHYTIECSEFPAYPVAKLFEAGFSCAAL